MKKFLFSIFISVGLCANAQETEFGLVAFIRGSVSVSNWRGWERSSRIWGSYARFYVSEKWAIQPELLLVRYRGELNDTASFLLNYIALPVLGRLEFTPEIFAFTGPQLGVLTSGVKEHGDKKEDYKRIYASWLFGAGYVFQEFGLEVSLRYELGLSDLHESDGIKAFMNTFGLVLSYRLAGGRPRL
ncbi:MAG: hypothetical protein CRN43_04270 [Candidatus Nephrothrix sp. EaCA]|nr:MAG: hypothetical protein CRN43_04270 [Candidatus Nephrothrix sp. EaCA]